MLSFNKLNTKFNNILPPYDFVEVQVQGKNLQEEDDEEEEYEPFDN